MGYLDNSTIVVDAILTKHGRKLLASLTFPELRYVVICLIADLYLFFLILFQFF